MNKQIISIVIALFIGLAAFMYFKKGNDTEKGVITIGAVLPLTGDVAAYGVGSKEGIDLAVEMANGKSNSLHFKVIYQDSMSAPKSAVNATEQLFLIEKPIAIIGENTSSSTGAIIPVIDRKKTLLISPSASAPNLSGASPYFFRVFPSDVAEGKFIARLISSAHEGTNIAVIYLNNDYGLGLKDIFLEEGKERNLKIVGDFGYDPDVKDFRPILAKVKSLNPDIIYIPSYYEDGGLLIKQIREVGIQAQLFGATTHEDPKLLSIAGNAAEGFKYPISTGFNLKDENPYVQDFIEAFTKKYGKEPGLLAALGYDCAQLIIKGSQSNGPTTNGIREFILKTSNIPGAAGTMNFDEKGDVHKPIILRQVKNGRFTD